MTIDKCRVGDRDRDGDKDTPAEKATRFEISQCGNKLRSCQKTTCPAVSHTDLALPNHPIRNHSSKEGEALRLPNLHQI